MKTEILNEMSSLHNGKLRFSGGVLFKSERLLKLEFVSDTAGEDDLVDNMIKVAKRYLPSSVKNVEIEFKKIVTQPEFVKKSIFEYLNREHKSCAGSIDEKDVSVEINGEIVMAKIGVEQSVLRYFEQKDVASSLKAFLETQYVDSFNIGFENLGKIECDPSLLELKISENDLHRDIIRTLKVDEVTRLCDNDTTDTASYMCDTKDLLGEVYFAGVVTSITESKTSKDKPFFIISMSDRTGTITGRMFPSKDKVPKIQKLAIGSEIIVKGLYEMYNGFRNLRINNVNLCCFPKNFVPVPRPKRPVPKEYSLVFPEKLVLEDQSNFLVDNSMPSCFAGRTFVAFDLETTGVNDDDKITEIGAVRIEDGKFISYFNTLVNPKKHISQEIEKLTGINDELVANAPTFEDVCADFYKYCDGATLVAHNIEFDSKFIRRQGKVIDFVFDHPLLDTLALARESIFGVSNYKLNTLCDKFNIKFNHHRAYSDALACAKLLVEIMRIKKEFPF